MDIKSVLERTGLDKKEAQLYLAAVELGQSSANTLSKKSGIHRTYFYDLAPKLVSKGVLKQIKKGKKTLYVATEPTGLLDLQKQKVAELEQAIPQLHALYNAKGQKPKVFYYEGKSGLEEINNDTLRYQGEIVGFTTPRFLTAGQQRLSWEYIQKRKERKIKARVIGEVSNEIITLRSADKESLRETKMLPKDIFHSEIELGVYANKVLITNYKSEFGLVIEDKDVAEVLKYIFEIVWNSGKIIG